MNRLREIYKNEIVVKLKKDLGLSNVMEAPKLNKIVVNAGIGEFRDSREAVESFVEELSLIVGQRPNPRKARLSEAGFKIKKGDVVGYSVTLRGERMWAFLDKFVNIVLPRVRDFQGLNLKSFDNSGNYSFGTKDHTIFPEVNQNKVKGIRGLQVNFSIKSNSKEHSLALLESLGMLFNKGKEKNNG
jgi:large subunit ribosomal protein L5